MRVVVTGASGNVGTALLTELARRPEVSEIVGVSRRVPSRPFPASGWRSADVARDDLVPIFRGADAVVHLAWVIQPSHDERLMHDINVLGSGRVFDAAIRAGVPSLVYASSVGAYAPGPKDRAVDESWPATGIESSFYARHKAEVERRLDRVEAGNPDVRIVRLRPGLIFRREIGSEVRRFFLGPFFPRSVVRPNLIPIVPQHERLRVQAVHSEDVARAYALAVVGDARGAFNVAAEPVIDGRVLAELLGARAVRISPGLLRHAADLTWKAHLQPTPPGWLDMGLAVPIMDIGRAREELGWSPRHSATEALREVLEGLRQGAGLPTPPLDPHSGGPLRVRELLSGVGAVPG
jgi:nucleoside-diphosphate-sugar epimerase